MSVYDLRNQTQQSHPVLEGITITGDALRRVAPESAEFLVEIAAAPAAAQALRDKSSKNYAPGPGDSGHGCPSIGSSDGAFNVYSQFGPVIPGLPHVLPAYAALRAALPFSFGAGAPQIAGELEYYARVSANFRLA